MFFAPRDLGRTLQALARIGYKNTRIMEEAVEKMNRLAYDQDAVPYGEDSLDINQVVFGGKTGFVPRSYVFRGFVESPEFHEYLDVLMAWKTEEREQPLEKEKIPEEEKKEMEEVLWLMERITDLSVETKEL